MPLKLEKTSHYSDSVYQMCGNTDPRTENIKSMSVCMQGNTISLGLSFANSQAVTNFIARITWRFDKKWDDRYRSSDHADYRFSMPAELGLYKNIITLVHEEFENFAEASLPEILNLQAQFFRLAPGPEDPCAIEMKAALEELLPDLNGQSPDYKKLDGLVAKIEPLEVNRYYKLPLYLLLANLLHECGHLRAAIYVLEEFDKKRKLTPREHARLSGLLMELCHSQMTKTMDDEERIKQFIAIISHALVGLAEMKKVRYADNSYQAQAECTLKEAIACLRGKNIESGVELTSVLEACIKPFRSKTFNRDFFDKLYNWDDYIKEVKNELTVNAGEVANIIIELIAAEKLMLAKKSVLNAFFKPLENADLASQAQIIWGHA